FALRQETDDDLSPTEYIDRFPPLAPKLERRLSSLRVGRTSIRSPEFAKSAADAPPPQMPGCEILAILGRGGMGIVYKAKQTALDRVVAIKMMRAGAGADPEERERFRTEVRAAALLQHPNIVQIYEVGDFAGQPYCVLEYVPDGSLQQRLAEGPMPPT